MNIVSDCGVYLIKNRINGMVYVGSSKDLPRRIWQHRRDLKKGCHHNRHLQNSWNKHGEENFDISEICWCALGDRAIVEKSVADQYGAFDRATGFNIGDPMLVVVSEETRKRMSEGMKGVNTWMKGRKQSPESLAKRLIKQRGMKRTPESRNRYRESKIGIKNPNYKLTDAQCDEIRLLMRTKIPRSDIANKFMVSVSHLFNIRNGSRRSITQLRVA